MQIKRDMTVNNLSKTIYTGEYTNVLSHDQHTNTAFFKDFQSMKLFVIMQSPGCFLDVYREARSVKYLEVNLFAPSIDISYISDIARLIAEIRQLGRKVTFHFPTVIPSYFSNITVLEDSYNMTDHVTYNPTRGNQFIVKYLPTRKQGIYNIEIHDGTHNSVLCGYMDHKDLVDIALRPDIAEIHLPYVLNRYGGLTAKEVLNSPRSEYPSEVRRRVRINGFQNGYELQEAKEKYPNRIVEVIER